MSRNIAKTSIRKLRIRVRRPHTRGSCSHRGGRTGRYPRSTNISYYHDTPYACNVFGPKSGFLPDDFQHSRYWIIPLDRDRMVARFAPTVRIALRPFFGSMGLLLYRKQAELIAHSPEVTPGTWTIKNLYQELPCSFRFTQKELCLKQGMDTQVKETERWTLPLLRRS